MLPDDPAAPSPSHHGRRWIVAAAVFWSTSPLFVKSAMFDDWPADDRGVRLAFWRALFAGLLLLPAERRPRLRPLMALMVLCFAGVNICYLSAMTLGTAANAIWLQNTAPIWVMLFGVVALGEPFTRKQAVTTLFLVVGLLVIIIPGLQNERPAGVLLGLASGVCYAAVVVMLRALRAEDGAWLVVLNHLGAATIIAPFLMAGTFIAPSSAQLVTLACFGFIQMGLAYYCFSRGLRTVTGSEAALIALIEPLLVPVWAYAISGERPSGATALGATAILCGLLYEVLARSPVDRRSNIG